VAFLYKGDGVVAASTSPLARAPWDRLIDVYKLAKMGNADCRRMWNSYAQEVPGTARLVVKSVQAETAEDARVTAKVDKRLRRAEKSAKSAKVTKSRKKAPAPSAGLDALGQARALLADPVLMHSDPWFREQAYRQALERRD
jgi:hypothetical protein